MTHLELKELLMPYADGELEPQLAAEVERALAESAELRSELAEIEQISLMARTAFEAPEADLSGVYDGVMARLGLQESAPQVERSLWARTKTWFGEFFCFEHPWALVGGGLAAAAAVMAVTTSSSGEETTSTQATVAKTEGPRRRGAEGEIKAFARDNAIIVEHLEAQKGKVKAEFDEDPEAPMVLWHVIDDEGTLPPKGL